MKCPHQRMGPVHVQWPWPLLSALVPLHLSRLLLIVVIMSSSPPSLAADYGDLYATCSKTTPFMCGTTSYSISYPFNHISRSSSCGRPGYSFTCDDEDSVLMLETGGKPYRVLDVNYPDRTLTVADPMFYEDPCSSWYPLTSSATVNLTLFGISPKIVANISLITCTSSYTVQSPGNISCSYSYWYYSNEDGTPAPNSACNVSQVQMNQTTLRRLESSSIGLSKALQGGFTMTWTAGGGPACDGCAKRGGVCIYNDTSGAEECVCSYGLCPGPSGKSHTRAIAIGVSVGIAFIIAVLIGLLLLYRKRKRKPRSSAILSSRTGSTDPSSAKESKEDLEFGTFPEPSISHYRTQVFTFEELRDATNGFSASNELGDGGFGTVYKGVLRDGRVVAVKQLYQQNYRRLERFMNEVDLLSDLRHPNLVILYGCTSRHSRELLLVFEYIPNGTVADHLYGTLADAEFMAWPIRMNIAIETADALRYLHEDVIPIIHRDVKTNNILLDNGFHVKVADFGLSRLFPLDATHVSTAPQGTPGYVDPEYHQCYQLTDKSDVYSFGVVLAELISSKPAVDITRQRSEINLANLTIKKIQNRELDQLVDPRLGYQSDSRTREMIDSVAEVAFRCLQLEREMRPTMKEVLEELKRIRSGGIKAERGASEADAEVKEDTHLLKNPSVHSPTSVTERWASVATTPNASG